MSLSDRITVVRKEFEDFVAKNQELLDFSQVLMNTVAKLKEENNELRNELEASQDKLRFLAADANQVDDSIKKARDKTLRLIAEIDERMPNR